MFKDFNPDDFKIPELKIGDIHYPDLPNIPSVESIQLTAIVNQQSEMLNKQTEIINQQSRMINQQQTMIVESRKDSKEARIFSIISIALSTTLSIIAIVISIAI